MTDARGLVKSATGDLVPCVFYNVAASVLKSSDFELLYFLLETFFGDFIFAAFIERLSGLLLNLLTYSFLRQLSITCLKF